MKTIAFIYETTKFYEELKKYTSPIIDTSKTLISWWMINETDTDSPDLFRKNYCSAGNAGLKRIFDEQKVDFVVIEYQEDTALMHKLFSYLDDLNIPVAAISLKAATDVNRILVPVCGGKNVSSLFWFVHLIAKHFRLPIHMLNVRNESQKYGGEDLVNDFIARSCGVISFEECVAPDISDGIVGNISDNDLVIVGAPNSWQLSKWFNNSIPYRIFTNSENTIMLNAPKAKRVHIRDAVWHELVNLQLEASDKKDAIRQLVQLLIASNQIVEDQKEDILKLFLKREEICSTGVGQETAFPHITLPGFSGLLCCLGVCPQGVSFAEDGNRDTKFIFLTISSPDYCSEYLDFLSQVARRMVNKNTRCRLLNAKSVNDALNILQPIII